MLSMVMFGFCFSNVVTSSFHSLYWTGEDLGGAQLMLIVTWPPPPPEDAAVAPPEQAATLSPRAPTAATAAIWRRRQARWCSCLLIGFPSMDWNMAMTQHTIGNMKQQESDEN